MKYASEFILPIEGLGLGKHTFTFDIERKFFELIDYDEVGEARIQVVLQLEKHENMIELLFHIDGWAEVVCDRCADEFHQPIEGDYRLILKYGEQYEEETDEIIIIPTEQHLFDVYQLIFEYIVLCLPIRKIHPDDAKGRSLCNKEVLQRLNQMHVNEVVDPRWEALKKINN